tara:strand:- start:11 stop:241 length:231 start_codon:yes stop_codon:yes gene_type:complete
MDNKVITGSTVNLNKIVDRPFLADLLIEAQPSRYGKQVSINPPLTEIIKARFAEIIAKIPRLRGKAHTFIFSTITF